MSKRIIGRVSEASFKEENACQGSYRQSGLFKGLWSFFIHFLHCIVFSSATKQKEKRKKQNKNIWLRDGGRRVRVGSTIHPGRNPSKRQTTKQKIQIRIKSSEMSARFILM